MTAFQMGEYASLRASGVAPTLSDHSRIAVAALQAGGATAVEARTLVAESLRNLRRQGITNASRPNTGESLRKRSWKKMNSDDPLAAFGQIFARQIDHTLDEIKRSLESSRRPVHAMDKAIRIYLESSTENERVAKVALWAMQKFSHNLFSTLAARDDFFIAATTKSHEIVDLKTLSDLFASEPDYWCDEYSKSGSAVTRMIEIYKTLQ